MNKETLKNSYQRFEEEGIMEVLRSKDKKTSAKLRLAKSWRPLRDPISGSLVPSGRLWDFTEKVASSRREGKNRRDGATVSTRVVAMADLLGKGLFEDALAAASGAPAAGHIGDAAQISRGADEGRKRRIRDGRAHL